MANKQHQLTSIIYDKRGRPLSIGQNSYVKTHPMQARLAKQVGLEDKKFIHAELAAIVKCKDLSKAHKISVFRYGARGQPLNAKPCEICAEAIRLAGIKIIEHT